MKKKFPGFNKRLESLINSLGISQKSLANRLGVTESSVSQWLDGEQNPSLPIIKLLNREFGVQEEWLKSGNGTDFAASSPDKTLLVEVKKMDVIIEKARRLLEDEERICGDMAKLIKELEIVKTQEIHRPQKKGEVMRV
jgi:transcriptional regulator with XRE-family HTH domain